MYSHEGGEVAQVGTEGSRVGRLRPRSEPCLLVTACINPAVPPPRPTPSAARRSSTGPRPDPGG